MAPLRQFANHPDPMDLWLESRGYYRKVTARDGSSLFRAISEQVYSTQRYHPEVRKQCVDFLTDHQDLFQEFDLEESIEEYLEHLQNPTQWGGPIEVTVFSILYKVNIVVFKEVGVQPQHERQEETEKTIMLCYSQDHHYDSVYHKDYTKVAGFCQSLVYEVLYKNVFMMKDVSYAVEKMLHYKPMRHRNDLGAGSPRKFLNFNCSSLEQKGIEDTPDCEVNVRELLNKGITPFPYKVAKSLDPNIFRNVEFDVWVDYRRGLRFGYFESSSELRVGVKCLVKLNDEGYIGHIQEMAADNGPVVLFIEELGEKRTVSYECLEILPQEPPSTKSWSSAFHGHRFSSTSSSKQTISSSEQGYKGRKGRDSESKSTGGSSNNSQTGSPRSRNRKTSQCNVNPDENEGNIISPQQGASLMTFGGASSTEFIPYSNYQVEADVGMPLVVDGGGMMLPQAPVSPHPRHSSLLLPLSPTTDDMTYRFAPFTYTTDPKDNGRLAATSPTGPACPTDYFHFVPYNNSSLGRCDNPEQDTLKDSNFMSNDVWKTQGQINFNAPKSFLDNGADLPMSDIQTLRFFYNLGNDVYRAQCYTWNGTGVCGPSCSSVGSGTSSCCGKAGMNVTADGVFPSSDTAASGPRRKRRETSVSSPGGVSMSSESEAGDFTPKIANAAPSPSSSQSSSHLPPRFKKENKSGGKSKGKEPKPEENAAPANSLSCKRSGESSTRLEPLILSDTKHSNELAVTPMTVPYGYVCYPNMPFSPVESDPNMPLFPSCRMGYPDYSGYPDGRQQCYSPVSDVGSPYPVYTPSSHFIFPASPGIYVGTPTWAAMTPPTPQ